MTRSSRQTQDRRRTFFRFGPWAWAAALTMPGFLWATSSVHPVTGIMAGAVSMALAVRWFAGRFAGTIIRHLEERRSAPGRGLRESSRGPAGGARWRRLEAARSGLVIPGPDPKAGRPSRA